MASGTKEIKRRIKSIKNTCKITRAMEMVSAAKMKKEVDNVFSIRDYAYSAWNILSYLSGNFEKYKNKLLEIREVRKILVVVLTSNRGLCGSFNTQLLKKLMEQVKNPSLMKINRVGKKRIFSAVPDNEIEFDFVAVGKKGFDYLHSLNQNIVAFFDQFNYHVSVESIRPLSHLIMRDYVEKKYDKVVVAFTDFINPLVQKPKFRQLLPVSRIDIEKQIEEMSQGQDQELFDEEKEIDYLIEPEPSGVLNHLLPRLVEMQLYHAICESNASKEAARMVAMKNATEAAGEMVNDLQYHYNQLRQASITQEIAEITSGQAALED